MIPAEKFEGETDLAHLQHFESDLLFWREFIFEYLIDQMLFLVILLTKLN